MKLEVPEELLTKQLNESRLGQWLELLFPDINWIHNKWFNGYRPDYVSHELHLIVEFDGPQHFQGVGQILHDRNRNKEFKKLDPSYETVRIPYFVQMTPALIKKLFKLNVKFKTNLSHGFIDDRMPLPACFPEPGLFVFIEYMINAIPEVQIEVFNSLKLYFIKQYNPVIIVPYDWIILLKEIERFEVFWKLIPVPRNPFTYEYLYRKLESGIY